jgi:Tfp pilus assembly protein PilF
MPLRRLIVEKLPLLLLVLGSSVITIIAQGRGQTIIPVERIGIVQRLTNAVVAYVQYFTDTFWPTGLGIFYPHPHHWPIATVFGSAAVLIIVTVICALSWRRAPWLIIGWLWFLGTLLPVIGLLQVGAQAWADRYTYLPQIGLLLATLWTIWRLLQARPLWIAAIVLAATAALVVTTQQQVAYWRNSRTLFTHTLAVTSENWYMHHALAVLAQQRSDAVDQERHLIELARILPRNAATLSLLADFYTGRNQLDKGIPLLERALEIDPNNAETLNNLAWWLATAPDARLRDAHRAIGLAERACAATDRNSTMYAGYLDTLSAAQAAVGRFDEAAITAAKALDIAIAQKQDDLAKQIGVHVRRYHAGLPAQ